MSRGTLYLLPVPLGQEDIGLSLPPAVVTRICGLTFFIAENAKTARAALKRIGHPGPMQSLSIEEYNEHTKDAEITRLLAPLVAGNDVGLMSEAGSPCLADPGEKVVAAAHKAGIGVSPLVGPSSILLALMGSGLLAESFEFVGYVPADEAGRKERVRALEADSKRKAGQTKIIIETPYRAEWLAQTLIGSLQEQTKLCIATDLLQESQRIESCSIKEWRQRTSDGQSPPARDRLAVFLISA